MPRLLPILLTLLCLAPHPAAAQDAREGGLSLEVSIQGPAHRDRPVKVLVSITNPGATPIALPGRPDWDAAGGLELEVVTPGGERRALAAPADMGTRSASGSHPAKPLTLASGQSLGVFRQVAANDIFRAPGTYRLTATYRRPGVTAVVSESVEVNIE
jgi:hypothetical protein